MKRELRDIWKVVLSLLLLFMASPLLAQTGQGDARKGQYLAKAAGCAGCHTDVTAGAPAYAGGRPLLTPFGKFFGPNITPHPDAGIGKWSESDFRRALKSGERPDGSHYYPAFPYPSFSGMTDSDIRDLWAYLRTVPPSDKKSKDHALKFPFGFRWLVLPWKWLFFTPASEIKVDLGNAMANRGAYVANALGHCAECHTPRNWLGGMTKSKTLGGGIIAEGRTPNLTPTRLVRWSDIQLADYLRTGTSPEGDVPSEAMEEVIRNSTSQLTPGDLTALIAYLRQLSPVPEEKR